MKQDFHQKRTHAGSLLSPAGLATFSVSLVKTVMTLPLRVSLHPTGAPSLRPPQSAWPLPI